MNRFLLALALCLFSIALAKSQNLEEEIEFNYIKAKYLLDTERYEDAIKAFTKIVLEDASYKDALLLRAQAKYAMAAYTGTKRDVLEFAQVSGMNELALILLGKADYKLGNSNAAINSLSIASMINTDDAQINEFLGNMYEENAQMSEACKYWQKATRMGSSRARIKVKRDCGGIVVEDEVVTERPNAKIDDNKLPTNDTNTSTDDPVEMKDNRRTKSEREEGTLTNPTRDTKIITNQDGTQNDTNTSQEDTPLEDENTPDDPPIYAERDDNMPDEDNTPNTIEIDEDLTLVIRGQGLGKRKILDQPNILILSDTDGTVTVDICVNKRGKVESAEFNSKLSTIAKKSLVSLAIRKAKDFWFEKNDYTEQCGVIMFKITGS